nr:RNA-directed DNA polymerase, eukaryota, reverse transcriptase zinc-binding domain protein [Tanacetum cinerariifolium]
MEIIPESTSNSSAVGSDDCVTVSFQWSRNSRHPMLDHQDKYMMKAQVHVSKSSAIYDVQYLPRKKVYQVANWYTRENLVKDGHPGTDEYVAADADSLQDNPLPTGRLPEAFLSMMGISPHHTPGDDMYPTFLQDDGPEIVPWTLANQDDPMHVRTDRRLRLDAKMRIPDLIRARTIRMVLRVDSELAETPYVFNSELRNAASPRREVTGEENAGAGSSAFVPRLSEGEEEEEDLPLNRKRKRSVVGESVPPRKVVRRDLGESSSTHPTVGGKSMGRLYTSSVVSPERSISPPTLGGDQPLPETSLALGTPVIQPVVHLSPAVLALEASVRQNIFSDSLSTSIMGSPTCIFTLKWNVPRDTLLTVPEVCADFLDNITPPGRGVYLEQLSYADLLREMSVTTAQHVIATAHLRSRFERQTDLKAQLAESVSAQAVLDAKMISKEMSEIYETATAKVSAQDNRLRRMNMEFDFELYPHFLSAIAERGWLIGSGLRLAVNNVLEPLSVREAFAGVVRAAGAKGKSRGLIDGFNHCAANGELTALPGYDPEAIEKFNAAMGKLKNLDLSFISDLEGLKDYPITSVMSSLVLPRSPGDGSSFEFDLESQLSVAKFVEGSSYENRHTAESERSLLDVLDAHAERVALKKSSKGGGPVWGVGAAHQPRPEGVLIGTSTLYPAHESFLARVAKGVQDTATPPSASGLKINMSKSKILEVHVDSDRVKEVALKIGCLTLKIPFLYLGSMVGGSMSRLHEWDEVVERVKTRLSKWKIKSLSIGGRLTLLKSVLGSMTIFHINKASWISWKKVLASMDKGGLCVSSLYALNRSLMFKWIWRFYTQGNSLWIRVIQAIYEEQCKIDADVKIRKQRGGVEQEQFENLVILMHDVSLSPMTDRWSWTLENSRDFTVSSIRKRIDDKLIPEVSSKTRWVNYVPIKVNVNAWKVKFDALPTRFNLSRRGIHIDSIVCVICDKEVETSWHLFFSCCVVRQMIRLIIRWWDVPHEEFDDYDDWKNWIVNLWLPSKSEHMIEAAKVERWAMSTWCHMFNSTLIGSARVWFDDLPLESTDSYDDLKKAFLANYLQQKKCIKDSVEIHRIKQRDGESMEDFVQRFKAKSRHVKGAPKCMRISEFMHGSTNPELIKWLHDNISKSVNKMMRVMAAFLQREKGRFQESTDIAEET